MIVRKIKQKIFFQKFYLQRSHREFRMQRAHREDSCVLCAKYEFVSSDTTRSTLATNACFVWAL
jgi:hypothetical protein